MSVFKNSPPHGSVTVRTRVVGRLELGLGSGPHVVGRLWSGMWVSASFQIIPRPVGRLGLGLGLGSGPRAVGRLESGMRVSVSFHLQQIALYRLAHGGGGGRKEGNPIPCKKGGGIVRAGECPRGDVQGHLLQAYARATYLIIC